MTDIDPSVCVPNTLELSRQGARLAAVQALFSMQLTSNSLSATLSAYKRDEYGLDEAGEPMEYSDPALFNTILVGVLEHQTDIDTAITNSLKKGWKMSRLDAVTVSIMRAATAELIVNQHLTKAIIISEYVALAYGYFDDPEPKFINACLDTIAKVLRES